MHVERCNISKAAVNPYLGQEIPDHEALGLDPSKIYYLYRDPTELAAAAPTFNNLPLLLRHIPISANAPQQHLVVGTIGSDVAFEAPYLVASIAIWTAEAITMVESGALEQLSCAYRYRADMTPGEADGLRYDGVMRNIIANHLALVEEGRAGPDVIVADQNPLEFRKMRFPKFAAALKKLFPTVDDAGLVALDAAMDEEMEAEDADLSDEEKTAAKDAAMKEFGKDSLTDEEEKDAYKRAAKDKKAKDAAVPAKPAQDSTTPITQADVDAAVARASAVAVGAVNALHKARADVAPLVGVVALDSADKVYEFALKQLNVDVTGVPPSAYAAMVSLAAKLKGAAPAPRIAQDAAAAEATAKAFPHLGRFRVIG